MVTHKEEDVEGVKIDATGDKNRTRKYGESDVQVLFRRGDWQNWDQAIRWLEQHGEADNELTPGETVAMTEDLRRLKESGAKFTKDPDQVFQMMHRGDGHGRGADGGRGGAGHQERGGHGEQRGHDARAERGDHHDRGEQGGRGKGGDGEKLPIPNYPDLTVDEATAHFDKLSHDQLEQIRAYEEGHLGRKTLLEEADRYLRRTEEHDK